MHMTASTICIVAAIVCEIVASFPPAPPRWNPWINWMTMGFAFALLSLIVGRV